MKIKNDNGLYAIVPDNHSHGVVCDAPIEAGLYDIDKVILTKHLNGKISAKLKNKQSQQAPEYEAIRLIKRLVKCPILQSGIIIALYHFFLRHL